MTAYYNDLDEGACEWLRELIKHGHIADGVVDNRSILEVQAHELKEFAQCHFFAGVGGWSYALRLAGWSDDRPVWTGSPPCQPFSTAGKRLGESDERHLAPHFLGLVRDARPPVLFGEQVASADVFGKVSAKARGKTKEPPKWAWLDDLSDRLEAAHYATGASDIPSAGVGAPNIRQRTFFGAYGIRSSSSTLANADLDRCQSGDKIQSIGEEQNPEHGSGAIGMEDASRVGRQEGRGDRVSQPEQAGGSIGVANTPPIGRHQEHADGRRGGVGDQTQRDAARFIDGSSNHGSIPTNGFWRDADWLFCQDGKWRPVEPGTFPLAHGVSSRMGLLRGYGNAINPWAAKEFIQAFDEAMMEEC